MNGAQDMGGMQCMGPVTAEENEPVFHGEWERRVLAVTLAMGAFGRWNIDMSRFAREDTPGADYLRRSYYETWLYGLEKLLVEKGFVGDDDIEAALTGGHAERTAEPALTAETVWPVLTKGRSARVDKDVAPKFAASDRVRVRNRHPIGHTRAPRYVRGRVGVINRDHGVFIFPDSHARDGTENPQHVYSVRFAATELWGPEAAASDGVYVDLWDDYLEPAGAAP
jgi:nitrile hydratase